MERFIGRERELKALSELYGSDGFQFVTVCGRRRVGKTSLIKEFMAGRKAPTTKRSDSKGTRTPVAWQPPCAGSWA